MSKVTFSAARPTTNPAHLQAARDIADLELLAFYRALACTVNPGDFKLPTDVKSGEQQYARLIAKRTSPQLTARAQKVDVALRSPQSTFARRLGRFGTVDFKSTQSVAAQVQARWQSPSLQNAITVLLPNLPKPPVLLPVAASNAKLLTQLTVHATQLTCVHETGSEFFEPDADSIDMAGALFDLRQVTAAGGTYAMGSNFRDGTVARYQPALLLGSVNIRDDGVWPKLYRGTVLLIERDDGGTVSDDVRVVFERVRDEVAKAVGKLVGTAAKALLGDVIGEVVGQVFEEALKAVANEVMRALGNDVFPLQSFDLDVPSAAALADAQAVTQQLSFSTDGGSYSLALLANWRRITTPIAERRVNGLRLTVSTGEDSLRSNCLVWVRVQFNDGTASPEVNLRSLLGQNPDAWTLRTGMLSLPSQRLVRDIKALALRFEGHKELWEADDNWHLRRVTVSTDGPDPVVQIIDVDGGAGLIKVLNPSDPNWSAAVNLGALHD